ncbi:MAG: D-alanyl-D-alanine carboxypeptidase [Clostridia bacterium]|nr:D-alanyl-D-alanine carboxypeptidase [Clostridia bacterium]
MKYYDDRPREHEEKYGAFFDAYDVDRVEAARQARQIRERAEREKAERARRKRKRRLRAYFRRAVALLIVAGLVIWLILGIKSCAAERVELPDDAPIEAPVETAAPVLLVPSLTAQTRTPGDDIYSTNAILVDAKSGAVLAAKNGEASVRPASLVKMMTALVAIEQVGDVKQTYTFPYEVLAPLYRDDEAVMVGYFEGEQATLDELFHGMLMVSGADAAMGLVDRAADSEEAFVARMNEKASELGMTGTHFVDPIGLSDDARTTCRDLAILVKAVLDNPYLRGVFSTENYTLPATSFHPDGIPLKHSMFAKMVGNEPEVATIKGGKTGFTGAAGYCLASYAVTTDGRTLIAVTTDANGSYRPVYDAFTLYKEYSHS